MPVTLLEAKTGMADKVAQQIVDEFRMNSLLLDKLTFDDAISPGTGGSTLTYGYVKLKTPATAQGRAINEEFTTSKATKEPASVDLKILGTAYEIDRVIAKTGGATFTNEVAFQADAANKATINLFHKNFIKGNSTTNAKEFDGLEKIIGADDAVDGSTVTLTGAMTEEKADAIIDLLDGAIATMIRKPDLIIASSKTLTKIKAAARKAGYYTRSEDAFGKSVDSYDGIQFLDMQTYFNGSTSVEIVDNGDVFLVCLGLDGVHAISPISKDAFIYANLPDYTQAGAVKEGDVEMVTAIAVKNSRAVSWIKGMVM